MLVLAATLALLASAESASNPDYVPIHDLVITSTFVTGESPNRLFHVRGVLYLTYQLKQDADQVRARLNQGLIFNFLPTRQTNFDPTDNEWTNRVTLLDNLQVTAAGDDGTRITFELLVPDPADRCTLAASYQGRNVDPDKDPDDDAGNVMEYSMVVGRFPIMESEYFKADTIIPISLVGPYDREDPVYPVFTHETTYPLSGEHVYQGRNDRLLGGEQGGGWTDANHKSNLDPNPKHQHRNHVKINAGRRYIMVATGKVTTTAIDGSHYETSCVIRPRKPNRVGSR